MNQNAINSDRAAKSEEKLSQAQKTMSQAASLLQVSTKDLETLKSKPVQSSDLEIMIRDLNKVIEKLNI